MKKTAILISFFVLASGTMLHAQNVGEEAPDFTLNKLTGGSWTLSDYSGKVISIFVFGFNCNFCENAGPTLQQELVDNYAGIEGYVPIGIDAWDGSAAAVQQFKDKTGITMPLLLNGSGVASLYDTPHDRLMVINAEGVLVYKGSGHANSDRIDAIEVINEELGPNAPTSLLNNTDDGSLRLRIYPNPARDNITLNFDLPESGNVNLQIVSIDGRLVKQDVHTNFNQGSHTLTFNLADVSPGMYYALLKLDNRTISTKFIVE